MLFLNELVHRDGIAGNSPGEAVNDIPQEKSTIYCVRRDAIFDIAC